MRSQGLSAYHQSVDLGVITVRRTGEFACAAEAAG